MTKSIFEQLGGTYKQQEDYLLPCLTLPAEKEQSIGYGGERVPVAHTPANRPSQQARPKSRL